MRRIGAIIKKQIKDTFKNKAIFIQFIMYPLIALLLTIALPDIANGEDVSPAFFVTMFATMYAGMVPNFNMATIITDEKDHNTLRMLMMSNVKPLEYLLGIGIYNFFLCTIGILAFGLIGGFSGVQFLCFTGILMLGVIASMLLGAAIGMFAKNQMSATSTALPVAMVFAFVPMIAMFNENFAKVGNVLYTQQINLMIADLGGNVFTWDRFAIIGANMLVFLALFLFIYKKGALKRD